MASLRRVSVVLWVVQGLLAAAYLFAGGFKLVAPPEQMSSPVMLPVWFLRFIGACEVLGALGLVLPGIFGIRTGLTPLAASGLVVIMIGATVLTFVYLGTGPAIPPLVLGVLAAWVAYARWRTVPLRGARVTT